MNKERLIDANELNSELFAIGMTGALTRRKVRFTAGDVRGIVDSQPTVEAVPVEWWDELKETVSELVENNKDVPENKQFYDCARFLLNLMNVIERRSDGRV